jgi:hypothetical protein
MEIVPESITLDRAAANRARAASCAVWPVPGEAGRDVYREDAVGFGRERFVDALKLSCGRLRRTRQLARLLQHAEELLAADVDAIAVRFVAEDDLQRHDRDAQLLHRHRPEDRPCCQ